MNDLKIKQMKEFRHRSRDELDQDLLYWAEHGKVGDYDALVNRLILEVSLDLRDQNERIIAILERGTITEDEVKVIVAKTLAESLRRMNHDA